MYLIINVLFFKARWKCTLKSLMHLHCIWIFDIMELHTYIVPDVIKLQTRFWCKHISFMWNFAITSFHPIWLFNLEQKQGWRHITEAHKTKADKSVEIERRPPTHTVKGRTIRKANQSTNQSKQRHVKRKSFMSWKIKTKNVRSCRKDVGENANKRERVKEKRERKRDTTLVSEQHSTIA